MSEINRITGKINKQTIKEQGSKVATLHGCPPSVEGFSQKPPSWFLGNPLNFLTKEGRRLTRRGNLTVHFEEMKDS